MASTVDDQEGNSRTAAWRRMAVLDAAAIGVATRVDVRDPAAAATPPWLIVSGGYLAFTIGINHVAATLGEVSQLVVEGNFGPSFEWAEFGLSRFGNVWTGVLGPFPPGAYHYRFRGDDTKILEDLTNPRSVTSQPTLSTCFVRGEAASPVLDPPKGCRGTVETIAYPGTGADGLRSATMLLPAGYDADRGQPYPVLYLDPGPSNSNTDWVELGRAGQILDNLAAQGRIEPMVVVIGDGAATDLAGELDVILGVAGARCNVSADPAERAIAGASSGGGRVLRYALTNPGRFGSVGSFAGDVSLDGVRLDAKAIDIGTGLLRIYIGNVTDPEYAGTARLMRTLDAAGVRYEFDGVNPAAGHSWNAWQANLTDFVQRLFGRGDDHGMSPGHWPIPWTPDPQTPTSQTATSQTPTGPTLTGPTLTTDPSGGTFASFETAEFGTAGHVTIWGNWAPNGGWLQVPMRRDGDRWLATIGPLPPGFYYYHFMVDMVATKDSANPTSITTEPTWSTFLAAGPEARWLADVNQGAGGDVYRIRYPSGFGDAEFGDVERTAYVWTPPDYDPARAEPYPVFYLQHGSGQSYTDWVEMGRAKQILDNLTVEGLMEPMVVVMGEGLVSDYADELLTHIVPAARANFNIATDPARQALAGLSMGGFQVYGVLRAYPGLFGYVATFSAALLDPTDLDVDGINEGTRLLRVYTGDATDFIQPLVMATLATFDELGVSYDFAGVTPGPHGWDVWQRNLIDLVPRLFRSGVDQ